MLLASLGIGIDAHASPGVTESDVLAADKPEYSTHKKQLLYASALAQRLTKETDPDIILDVVALQSGASVDIGLADKLTVLLDAAQSLAAVRGDAVRIATVQHLKARARYFSGDDASAIVDSRVALEAQRRTATVEREHRDPTRLYRQTIEHAFMLQGIGQDVELIAALRAAQRLLPLIRNRELNTIALDYMFSSLMLTLGDKDAAITHLGAALAAATNLGDRGWQSEIQGARSIIYLESGDITEAIETAMQYRTLALEEGNRLAEANAELYLAEAHRLRSEPALAYASGRRALALYDALDDSFMKADARRELALSAASLGRAKEAETLLLEALQLRPEETSIRWRYHIARVRTAIAIASTDLAAVKRAKEEEDKRALRRHAHETASQTKALREFHEVNARELQLQLLQRERDLHELEMKRGEARIFWQRVAIGAGAALLCVAAFLSLLLYRRSRILREAAETDTLTGAKSRGAILAYAESLWTQARPESRCVAACVIDIDHFKRFNDEHGHATGDQVLTRCVDIIRRNLRQRDAVGRIGGDEFLIVMDNVSEERAVATARRIVEAVRTDVLAHGEEGALRASISVGVAAMLPSLQSSVKQLIQRADTALIEAKNAGKDQVLAFGDRAAAAA
jgi:diguanylate cyclase (GGDEF)-like protein